MSADYSIWELLQGWPLSIASFVTSSIIIPAIFVVTGPRLYALFSKYSEKRKYKAIEYKIKQLAGLHYAAKKQGLLYVFIGAGVILIFILVVYIMIAALPILLSIAYLANNVAAKAGIDNVTEIRIGNYRYPILLAYSILISVLLLYGLRIYRTFVNALRFQVDNKRLHQIALTKIQKYDLDYTIEMLNTAISEKLDSGADDEGIN